MNMETKNEYDEDEVVYKDDKRKFYQILIFIAVFVLILLILIGITVSYTIMSNKKIVDRAYDLCTQLCNSHNGSMSDLRSGAYTNDVCVCKQLNGEINTYII